MDPLREQIEKFQNPAYLYGHRLGYNVGRKHDHGQNNDDYAMECYAALERYMAQSDKFKRDTANYSGVDWFNFHHGFTDGLKRARPYRMLEDYHV